MADYFVDFREDLKSKILDPNQIYFSTSVSKLKLFTLDSELTSLQSNILTEINESHPEWQVALDKATPGRLLLDIKRSGAGAI